LPHAPQFALSVCSARHAAAAVAPHTVSPLAQPHAPAWHVCPVTMQRAPQAPQCEVLTRVSTSQPFAGALSQSAKPGVQLCLQAPDTHEVSCTFGPAVHRLPHAPQLFTSLDPSMHRAALPEPQRSSPPAQPHTPLRHSRPAPHAVPHAPQLFTSVSTLVHTAEAPVPQSSLRPPGMPASHPQRPARHTVPAPHDVPHAPQLPGSACRSTHNMAVPAPQRVRPPVHAMPHAPPLQSCPSGHALLHAPQLFALDCGSTHTAPHKSWRFPADPRGHAQRPMKHACPLGHAVPHAPQFVLLEAVSTQAPPQRVCPAGHAHTPAAQL